VRDTEDVEEYCTCGARLVADATFCHKCGRPVRDLLPPDEEAPAPVVEPVAVAPPPPPLPTINFRNPIAVRTAFAVASICLAGTMMVGVAGSMPLNILGAVLLAPASGFIAVWLYRRRTSQTISVREGARLGFITGVFSFVYSTILSTLTMFAVASSKGLLEMYREMGWSQETLDAMAKVLESPVVLVLGLLFGLAASFLLGTVSASVGGAVGAKVLEKD
jgi:hypothetical protein